jgi:hypothetical protein
MSLMSEVKNLAERVKARMRTDRAQDRFVGARFAVGICRGRKATDSKDARCRYGTELSHGLLEF